MPVGGDRAGRRQAYLDEMTCFQQWNDLGSLAKSQKALVRNGVVNPATGKPPTVMAIRAASMRYMLKHPEDARMAITNTVGGEWAEDRSFYYNWMNTEVAAKILSETRYEEWQKENEEMIDG